MENYSIIVSQIIPNITEEMIPSVWSRVKDMDDSKLQTLAGVPMKSPSTTVILACLLGSLGIDRFYLGDTMMGVLKLITGGGCGIWSLIDFFTAISRAKKSNYNKLQMYL